MMAARGSRAGLASAARAAARVAPSLRLAWSCVLRFGRRASTVAVTKMARAISIPAISGHGEPGWAGAVSPGGWLAATPGWAGVVTVRGRVRRVNRTANGVTMTAT